MEGLNTRSMFLACVMASAGAWVMFSSKVDTLKRTEDELLAMAPMKVAGMDYLPAAEDGRFSYKMDEMTYRVLAPFGIVARQYTDGVKGFDAVLIASRSKASFHDPRVCFSAQGFTLEKMIPSTVVTKSRGTVPITLITMTSDKMRNQLAAFFYRGPGGKFYGSTQKLKLALLWEQFSFGKDIDGVFYRVFPTNETTTEEELKKFIGDWLDAANESSKGYF